MELRHFLTFRAVLREGSFLKAARALRLAQPTVTLHIQELEAELGLELFDRRGRRRPQTPAGELFAERALPILDAVDSLARSMAELRDGRSGLLRIGSIEPAASQRVTPLLGRLQRAAAGPARAAGCLGDGGRQPGRRRRRRRPGPLLRAAGRARPSLRASLFRGDGPARAAGPSTGPRQEARGEGPRRRGASR